MVFPLQVFSTFYGSLSYNVFNIMAFLSKIFEAENVMYRLGVNLELQIFFLSLCFILN